MTREHDKVSVIIPCRNEEKFIGKCLDSIIANDYPRDRLEILVIDGMSEDGTRRIAEGYRLRYPFVKVFANEKKIVPSALNAGIRKASGDILIRMDAHNTYESDYISKCVRYLQEYGADNVGGVWVTMPGREGIVAESIAAALTHPFGVGNAYYRIGSVKPKYVDTVPFGCYRRKTFEEIGLFDEDLVRNQDDEFNMRLIRKGGRILLAPDVVSYYYARDSLTKLWKMYYQYGYFKPLAARKVNAVLTLRQLVPPAFVNSVILAGALSLFLKPFIFLLALTIFGYIIASLGCSLHIAFKKGFKHLPLLPLVFATIHVGYGLGYDKGFLDFIVLRKNRKRPLKDAPLTR